MSAENGNLSEEELSEILKISTQFFGSTPSIKEEIEREIENEVNSLLVRSGFQCSVVHEQDLTPTQRIQIKDDFFGFNSVKTLKHV